jgi:integrase
MEYLNEYEIYFANLGKSQTTVKTYIRLLKKWNEWRLNQTPTFEITDKSNLRYIDSLNGSIKNLTLAALKSFGKYTVSRHGKELPFANETAAKVKRIAKKHALPQPVLVEFVKQHAKGKEQLDAAFLLMALRGLRTIEVVRLKVCDFKENHIVVTAKGGKQNNVVLNSILVKHLKRLAKNKGENDHLFTNKSGGVYNHNQFRLVIKSRIEKAYKSTKGVKLNYEIMRDFSPHQFRHTLVELMIKNNVGTPKEGLERLLRHENQSLATSAYVGDAYEIQRLNEPEIVEHMIDKILLKPKK